MPSASQASRVSQHYLCFLLTFLEQKYAVTGHEAPQTCGKPQLRSCSQNSVSPTEGLDKSLTGWRINQKKILKVSPQSTFNHKQLLEHAFRWNSSVSWLGHRTLLMPLRPTAEDSLKTPQCNQNSWVMAAGLLTTYRASCAVTLAQDLKEGKGWEAFFLFFSTQEQGWLQALTTKVLTCRLNVTKSFPLTSLNASLSAVHTD